MSALHEAARRYAELGYRIFPCVPGKKTPLTEHGFKDATTDPEKIEASWSARPNANIGMATEGLLAVDIDGTDNPWPGNPEWVADLSQTPTSLTPRGGRHHVFQLPPGVTVSCSTSKIAPNVDIRANGGYIVVPPSFVDGKAYRWVEGHELNGGRESLPIAPAWILEQIDLSGQPHTGPDLWSSPTSSLDPIDPAHGAETPSFGPDDSIIPETRRNDSLARLGGKMRRYGMTRAEILAALLAINAGRCRPPLSRDEVERIATSIARYTPNKGAVDFVEGYEGEDAESTTIPEVPTAALVDPGQMPEELFRIPGFISEVMDHCLATAPYPNQVMAFAGALALQAALAGRKVRDPGNNRTNLHLLGLAYPRAGKDRPRKLNAEVMHAVGLSDCLGSRFASGEGIQDALLVQPCMLFQTDEIDGLLESINKARDARHENLMSTLLTMYSSADSVFSLRRKAGKDAPGSVDQPCLVLFGTAIPSHYYEALSNRMLSNGFFARMIVLECGYRSAGQEPSIQPLPPRVLETARFWADLRTSGMGLPEIHPVPRIVPQTEEARLILIAGRLEAEAEYAKSEAAGDEPGTTVWGRVSEHTRKLALLYAISENHTNPEIGRDAASWAQRFAMHQARRMLFMAASYVAENPFDVECLKLLKKLRSAPGGELPHSNLLKRMKTDAQTFQTLVATLEQRGDIVTRIKRTRGATAKYYCLAGHRPTGDAAPAQGG